MDPNPLFGRVVYTPGVSVDQPLAVTRYRYVDYRYPSSTYTDFAPMSYMLFWTQRGQMGLAICAAGQITCQQNGVGMWFEYPMAAFAYDRPRLFRLEFQGTLVADKEDGARTFYRRNRVYDPASGRFTQEDPIGIAGGLNLYGFAGGDPVNFSDPFGLCPDGDLQCAIEKALAEVAGGLGGFLGGFGTGAALGGLCGPAAEVCSPVAGTALGVAGGLATAKAYGAAVDAKYGGTAMASKSSGSGGGDGSGKPKYKVPASGKSASEAARDVPSWAKGNRPQVGENGKDFAKRLMDSRYGEGKWNLKPKDTGPGSEFSKIKKWGDRGFVDPPSD